MATETDEFFHERSDDPYWNESGWFGFSLPERTIAGAVYMHHRPNRGYAWAGLLLWDAVGRQIHDCLWHDFAPQHLPSSAQVPLSAKVFEYDAPNGLSVRNPRPLERYEFAYRSAGCEADLVFDAFMEPHDSGLAAGWGNWGSGHYEQCGRMQGMIRLGDERLEVDYLTTRDRSWGPHNAAGLTRGAFDWGLASPEHGFGVQAISTFSAEDDPVVATTEPVRTGWYRRDGCTAQVSTGERRLERAEDGTPVAVHVTGTDELGRDFIALGRCVNVLDFAMFGGQIFWYWSLAEWQIDDAPGWGEDQDIFNGRLHRRFIRANLHAVRG